jgi:pathogenesis-related protein 1
MCCVTPLVRTAVFVLLNLSASAEWARTGVNLSSEMLAAHNAVREDVGVPKLIWSPDLARAAQVWANRLASEGALRHSPNPKYGENLYLIHNGRSSAREVVNSWAAEASDYDYPRNTCRSRCGHYTQIIWSETRQLGCAVARRDQTEVWVCEYNPPGNYVGERPY